MMSDTAMTTIQKTVMNQNSLTTYVKELDLDKICLRIENDTNGNPRYIVPQSILQGFAELNHDFVRRMKDIGFKPYKGKKVVDSFENSVHYVFQSFQIEHDVRLAIL